MKALLRTPYLALGLLLLLSIVSCATSRGRGTALERSQAPKREFRGAWLPTIYRSEYTGLSRTEGRRRLSDRIELLHRMGCNVVLFQVRAESDAWYRSSHEPWSRFFTGTQGVAPSEDWDPLAFVIEECHRRGMELHAWINPFRGASNVATKLASNHPASRHPEWFVTYAKQLILDPGIPEGRRYVAKIVQDLVSRYDFDALHIDDYFYPYPIKGEPFPDEASFARYGITAGYSPGDKDRWRRDNINLLVYEIRQTLLSTKPWVRLGVSPFGIYRNASTDPKRGSRTAGLQCYDDLYADVLHWANEGWVDYVAPQIYWNIGHTIADYDVLVRWWDKHLKNKRVQLYIGQDVKRTMDADQLDAKILLSRGYADGNIFWPGDELVRNYMGAGEQLREVYQRYRALLPEYRGPLGKTRSPKPITVVWEDRNEDGHLLMWQDERINADPESPFFYVVYGFAPDDKPSVKKSANIVSISTEASYRLPRVNGRTEYTFLVTAVNRFWQESKPYKIKVRL